MTTRCAACQRWPMENVPVVIEPVGDGNYQAAVQFLAGWSATAKPTPART